MPRATITEGQVEREHKLLSAEITHQRGGGFLRQERQIFQRELGGTEGRERCALLTDAQILLRKKVCAVGMGQNPNDAVTKDAKIKSSMEECARGMGQRLNAAATKDVGTMLRKEECATDTGQSGSDAAKKDVQT
jgi:hypothetical protein